MTLIVGYIKRGYLVSEIEKIIKERSQIPVESGESMGYELGHALGYVDALKYVLELVKQLPEEPKPEPSKTTWHRR